MKTDVKYYFWNKGEVYQFNKYFKTSEFSWTFYRPKTFVRLVLRSLLYYLY